MNFQNRGYFKVLLHEPTTQPLGLVEGRHSIRVIATVDEGLEYKVGFITFQSAEANGAMSIPAETLRKQFHLQTGDLFRVSEIREWIARANALYPERGKNAVMAPDFTFNDAQHTLNVTFHVKEAAK
jgi:outer membrane protein assembly factor BamA